MNSDGSMAKVQWIKGVNGAPDISQTSIWFPPSYDPTSSYIPGEGSASLKLPNNYGVKALDASGTAVVLKPQPPGSNLMEYVLYDQGIQSPLSSDVADGIGNRIQYMSGSYDLGDGSMLNRITFGPYNGYTRLLIGDKYVKNSSGINSRRKLPFTDAFTNSSYEYKGTVTSVASNGVMMGGYTSKLINPSSSPTTKHHAIWRDGKTIPLAEVTDPPISWSPGQPLPSAPRYSNVVGHAMNDSGMIVVSAEDAQNPTPPIVNPDGTTTDKDSLLLGLPVGVAVDADRDGEITFNEKDKTTAAKPYRFWINDDVDKGNTVDGNDYEEDDLNESAKDSEDGKLNFRRDLEDLTRIRIDFSSVDKIYPSSDITVELKVRIEAAAGQPAINLYQPVELDGKREYLKDEAIGFNQLQGSKGDELCKVTGAAVLVPRRAWETLPLDKVVHLLFEGSKEGEGKIVFELWKGGEKIFDFPPVHIDLKKAEDMYETWTVGDVAAARVNFTNWPSSAATQTSGQDIPAPEKPEEKDYVMFVHGWNMPPWEKETFASTMFKRMWHQGFKGRFGAFRWPTFHGLSGPSWGNLKGENIHTAHFDGSEERAWNSASALKNLLIDREAYFGTNKIRLYAHSMGNIVSSEALRQMAPSSHVNTYISAQAAISSHVWDKTTPQMTFNSPFELKTPNVYGYYWKSLASRFPHNWENEGTPSYMDPQYMPSGTTYINHYNPLDWALSYNNWQINQVLKPDFDYDYGWPGLDFVDIGLRFWKTQSIPPFRNLTFPNDRFEVFSYAAQSHGYATGQQGATGGKFNAAFSVNLRGEYGFESAHKGHSAQFRSTIQKRWTYWRRALKDMNINLPTP